MQNAAVQAPTHRWNSPTNLHLLFHRPDPSSRPHIYSGGRCRVLSARKQARHHHTYIMSGWVTIGVVECVWTSKTKETRGIHRPQVRGGRQWVRRRDSEGKGKGDCMPPAVNAVAAAPVANTSPARQQMDRWPLFLRSLVVTHIASHSANTFCAPSIHPAIASGFP